MTKSNNQKYPLKSNGKSFGGKYQIDAIGTLYDAAIGAELAWEREVAIDLSLSKKERAENARKRKFSRLTADCGAVLQVSKAEAIAWSVPSVADGRKDGYMILYLDGDKSNEVAANLSWDTPQKAIRQYKRGRVNRGNNPNQILWEDDAREVLAYFNPKDPRYNSRAFSEKFGVAQTTINNIVCNKTFQHIDRAEYISNPHISQTNYYDTYRPTPKSKKYAEYVALGKPVNDEVKVKKTDKTTAAAESIQEEEQDKSA